MKTYHRFTMPAHPQALSASRRHLALLLTTGTYCSSQINEFILAVGEALSNAIEHGACEPGEPITIHLSIEEEIVRVEITYKDWGFCPEEKTLLNPLEYSDGGLGRFFMEHFADQVDYQFLPGLTTITLLKRMKPPAKPLPPLRSKETLSTILPPSLQEKELSSLKITFFNPAPLR